MYEEEELLKLVRAGNEAAFSQLYRLYSGRMYANVLKMVKDERISEDIVQEIFARIWQKRESLSFEQGFPAYIYRMGQNLVIDFYRRLKRDRVLYAHFKGIATQHYTHIEETLQHRENQAFLQNALEALPAQQRRVYQLCKVEGLSYKEAALKLDISAHTVKEYLSKATQSVRSYLNDHMDTAIGLMLVLIIRESC
jgi:RNA polymerase sigma-70 factor (family 1)